MQTQALTHHYQQPDDLGLALVVTPAEAKARLHELQEFVREVMIEGEDYGTIPGTTKPTLFKPGAEKLCEIYGLAPILDVTNRIEVWEGIGFFHYEVRCQLVSKRTGQVIAVGIGSCNSKEGRYRWRDAKRRCPHCGAETIFQSKPPQQGFYCWNKKGGCGATFIANDPAITGQSLGKVENDDIFTQVNTILKMAKKRAVIDATLSATRSSALFTQDLEDLMGSGPISGDDDSPVQQPALRQQPQRRGEAPRRGATTPARQGVVVDGTATEVPTPATTPVVNNVTVEQGQEIALLVQVLGWSPSDVAAKVGELYQHTGKVRELTREQVTDFLDYLRTQAARKQVQEQQDSDGDANASATAGTA